MDPNQRLSRCIASSDVLQAMVVMSSPFTGNAAVQRASSILEAFQATDQAWFHCSQLLSKPSTIQNPAIVRFSAQIIYQKARRRHHKSLAPKARRDLADGLLRTVRALERYLSEAKGRTRTEDVKKMWGGMENGENISVRLATYGAAVLVVDIGMGDGGGDAQSVGRAIQTAVKHLAGEKGGGESLAQVEFLCAVAEICMPFQHQNLVISKEGNENRRICCREYLIHSLFPSVHSLLTSITSTPKPSKSVIESSLRCFATWLSLATFPGISSRIPSPLHCSLLRICIVILDNNTQEAQEFQRAAGEVVVRFAGVIREGRNEKLLGEFTGRLSTLALRPKLTVRSVRGIVEAIETLLSPDETGASLNIWGALDDTRSRKDWEGILKAIIRWINMAAESAPTSYPAAELFSEICSLVELIYNLATTEIQSPNPNPYPTGSPEKKKGRTKAKKKSKRGKARLKNKISKAKKRSIKTGGLSPTPMAFFQTVVEQLEIASAYPSNFPTLSSYAQEQHSLTRRRVRDCVRVLCGNSPVIAEKLVSRAAAACDFLAGMGREGRGKEIISKLSTAEAAIHCASAVAGRLGKLALRSNANNFAERFANPLVELSRRLCVVGELCSREHKDRGNGGGSEVATYRVLACAGITLQGQLAGLVAASQGEMIRRVIKQMLNGLYFSELAKLFPMRVSQDHVSAPNLLKIATAIKLSGKSLSIEEFKAVADTIYTFRAPSCSLPDPQRSRPLGGGPGGGPPKSSAPTISGYSYLLLLESLGILAPTPINPKTVSILFGPPMARLEDALVTISKSNENGDSKSAVISAMDSLVELKACISHLKTDTAIRCLSGHLRTLSHAGSILSLAPKVCNLLQAALNGSSHMSEDIMRYACLAAEYSEKILTDPNADHRHAVYRGDTAPAAVKLAACCASARGLGDKALSRIVTAVEEVYRNLLDSPTGFDANPELALEVMSLFRSVLATPPGAEEEKVDGKIRFEGRMRFVEMILRRGLETQDRSAGREALSVLTCLVLSSPQAHKYRLGVSQGDNKRIKAFARPYPKQPWIGELVSNGLAKQLVFALLIAANGRMASFQLQSIVDALRLISRSFPVEEVGRWIHAALEVWPSQTKPAVKRDFFQRVMQCVREGDKNNHFKPLIKRFCGGKKKGGG
ncbi:hypothetical protein AAMO2058_000737600 [Amorphochlora amoebiformis]